MQTKNSKAVSLEVASYYLLISMYIIIKTSRKPKTQNWLVVSWITCLIQFCVMQCEAVSAWSRANLRTFTNKQIVKQQDDRQVTTITSAHSVYAMSDMNSPANTILSLLLCLIFLLNSVKREIVLRLRAYDFKLVPNIYIARIHVVNEIFWIQVARTRPTLFSFLFCCSFSSLSFEMAFCQVNKTAFCLYSPLHTCNCIDCKPLIWAHSKNSIKERMANI